MSTLEQTNELTLDLSAVPGDRSKLTIYAKQEDSVRRVVITLQQNGEDYTIPPGVGVLLRALKPDGRYVLTECAASTSKVYIALPREVLTRAGCVRAEVCLTAGEEILTSATFYIEVVPYALSEVASCNDLSALAKAMDAANTLLSQALVPVAVETVESGTDFTVGAATVSMYSTEPVWQGSGFATASSGALYSDYHAALAAGAVYFFDSTDHTYFCKLLGSENACTGYMRYRPLGTSGGLSAEFRDLLDGKTVEGRALPTSNEAAKLSQLTDRYYFTANSTSYHLMENSLYAMTYIWIQSFTSALMFGRSADFGTGKQLRFVSDEEMAELNRRITALGG